LILSQACKVLRDVVANDIGLQYALALAARGLCDGPPSAVTVTSRFQLLKAHEEAWRTFSWSKHLALDLPYSPIAPCVSGGTLVLPVYHGRTGVRSFVVQSIPSPLRGVPDRHWQMELDFFVGPFIVDAAQDLLAVVPTHDVKRSVNSFTVSLSLLSLHICSRELLPCSVLMRTLSTGQPHALSANEGVLRLEEFRYVAVGSSKRGIKGDFIGIITCHSKEWDDRLFIWNWKSGALQVNMVRDLSLNSPFFSSIFSREKQFGKENDLIAQPIRVGSLENAVFSFLDDHHFVVPTLQSECSSKIILNVYQFSHQCEQQQQQVPPIVRSYVLSIADVLIQIHTLRFFPDVTGQGGAPPGHFYTDAAKRMFGIQIDATSLSTQRETVQELLVPVRALMGPEPAPQYQRVSVCYEPVLGRQLAYASRVTEHPFPVDKLPPALRGVSAHHLRFAVCCGALLVFEVGLGCIFAIRRRDGG
jgi:hypothetical protein